MTVFFLDSSALVKRYVHELGLDVVRALAESSASRDDAIIVAHTSWVEVCSAFARLARERSLQPEDLAATLSALRFDWDSQYQVIELDTTLVEAAADLLFRQPLRAFDAKQLASCMRLRDAAAQLALDAVVFVSSDDRLLDAARNEGLRVQNPNEMAR